MAGYITWMASTLLSCVLFIFLSSNTVDESEGRLKIIENSLFHESPEIEDTHLRHTMKGQGTRQSPVQMFTFPRQSEPETQAISRAAQMLEINAHLLKAKASQRHKRSLTEAELVSLEELELIANQSGCPPPMQKTTCPTTCLASKYRDISGVCNNRNNPLWGAANTALIRWLPAEYEDEKSQPKGWNAGHQYNGFALPLAREVSNKIMQGSSKKALADEAYSQMFVDWGQYVDHDISFTPQSASKAALPGGPNCLSTCENINPCFPIKVPTADKLFGTKACLPFFRSSPACITADSDFLRKEFPQALQRQQMNAITSFLDASTVYGHTPALQNKLRNLSSPEGGLAVNVEFTDHGLPYLPFVSGGPSACYQDPEDPQGQRVECFLAGDSRASEVLPLSALHTLWLREHNRIASTLKGLNPHWSPEQTYQEARKIVGALHQVIMIRDYVPKLLGAEAFDKYVGAYKGYDSTMQPMVSNVFATAAFRFGHATIPAVLRRLNGSFQEHQNYTSVSLHQTFFSPWRLIKEGGLDPVLRGLLGSPAVAVTSDHLMTEELTEKLVVLSTPANLDLTALNLQRGRDHGLPGYNEWREFCGLERIQTQADLSRVISDPSLVQKLMDTYRHPSNIDVWLGGLVEDHLPGARTGPLFACLIGKQIKMLREGDRFWWEKDNVFTQKQRDQLQRHLLSRVICDNSGVEDVPLDSFRLGQYPEDFVSCENVPSMNLKEWREDSSKVLMPCGSPAEIKHGDFVFCSTSDKVTAVYSCHYGYHLEGSEEIVCTEDGWSSQPPVCIGK